MRRIAPLLIAASFLGLPGAAGADVGPTVSAKKKVVAILPFTSPSRWSSLGRNAQATFVTTLVKTRKVRVIQASLVRRMLRRRGLHWTGTVDARLLKAAQRWLKADLLLAGKLRWTGGAYTLSAHLMDVRSLQTTIAEDVDFRSTRKMRVAARLLARKVAGLVSGTGGGGSGALLNVNRRALYDSAAACIRVMKLVLNRYRYSGRIQVADERKKKIKVKGWGARRLKKGVALDVFDTSGIEGKKKIVTAYVTRIISSNLVEAKYLMGPTDGIPLTATVSNRKHQWVVAVGKIVDQAESNRKLAKKFRSTLLQKMSEGTDFQQIEQGTATYLAKLSHRRKRFFAFRKLFARGVEVVLEGKFYGSAGRRRAHFKFYSTLTGKTFGELKFETKL